MTLNLKNWALFVKMLALRSRLFKLKRFYLIFAETAFDQKQILCERIITSMTGNFEKHHSSIRVWYG